MTSEEKIIEIIAKEQLMEYIEENNIITEYQSAYRKNFSCETALNLMISECKEELEKSYLIIVFLDLKRAFETVERERMKIKMKTYGIKGNELKWFESYMKDRKQIVIYKNEKSDPNEIPIGLPQGTQLSVILFLLYINDIIKAAKHGKIMLFADDTVLITKCNNIQEGIQKTNEDLESIYNWLNANKLKLNIEKTKYMLISKKDLNYNSNEIKIGDQSIERVKQIKYLGIQIDDKLTLNAQIEGLTKKIATKTNFLYRISRKLTQNTKKMIYNSFILPHFDFCSTLYIGHTQAQLKQLQKLQNRALRIILNCEFRTETKYMLDTLKMMSVKQRWMFNLMTFIFKIKNNLAPKYLTQKLKYNNDTHNLNTRNKNELRLPNIKSKFARNTIFYNGIKMYNTLPPVLKHETNIKKFKINLEQYIKQNINIR